MRVVGTFEKHSAPITCVALAPDKTHAVSGDEDDNVLVWRVQDLREIQRQKAPGVLSVASGLDGTLVAAGCPNGSVRL
jgi:WD40 repeat protein